MTKKVRIDYGSIDYTALAALGAMVAFPHGWKSLIPGYDLYKLVIDPLAQKIINSARLVSGNDLENIIKIIKAGQENGADELEMKITKEVGINIGANLNLIGVPCDADFKVGAEGEIIIKIKYK